MKFYVHFLQKAANSDKIVEACGDSAYYILDGRNTMRVMIVDALNRLEQMNKPGWNHQYVGFNICKGDLRSSRIIHTYIKEKKQ